MGRHRSSTELGTSSPWQLLLAPGQRSHCIRPSLASGSHPTSRPRRSLVSPVGLSDRNVEELLAERGIDVDLVTEYHWVLRFAPLLAEGARRPPARRALLHGRARRGSRPAGPGAATAGRPACADRNCRHVSPAAGCRVDAGSLENQPHGTRRDRVPEPGEFTLDASVAPGRVLSCHPQDQATELRRPRRSPGRAVRLGPVASDPRSRCQRSNVPGVTNRWRRRCPESSRVNAKSTARPGGSRPGDPSAKDHDLVS